MIHLQSIIQYLLVLSLMFFSSGQLLSVPDSTSVDTVAVDSSNIVPLKVALKSSPPFVYKDENGNWEGISVYLWEQLAQQLNVKYQYIDKKELGPLLKSLENGEVDLSINPLTVTSERIEHIDFTQPFYIANSVVTMPAKADDRVWGFLSKIFSVRFLQAILLLFMVVFLGGFFVWWFEHKKNPQFKGSWSGIWSGVWWSAATMTTVGYGDKAPQTVGGQIVGLVWMFAALLLISGFMAGIASALTVEELKDSISQVEDLRKVNLGSVDHSASEHFLNMNYLKSKKYENIDEGLTALGNGQIEAFVYDEPILLFEIRKKNMENTLKVLPMKFNTQYYGFGLPKNSPLLDKINPNLLDIIEHVGWKAILTDYGLTKS